MALPPIIQTGSQALTSFDRILLPVSITGLAASLGKYPEAYLYPYVGSWLLLTYWIFLSWRYRTRQDERFDIVRDMESCLGFEAHRLLKKIQWPPRDRCLRWIFYWLVVLLAVVAGAIHHCVPRVSGVWLWRILPWCILPVTSFIF